MSQIYSFMKFFLKLETVFFGYGQMFFYYINYGKWLMNFFEKLTTKARKFQFSLGQIKIFVLRCYYKTLVFLA